MWRCLAPGVLLISAVVGCGQDTPPWNDLRGRELTGPVHVVQQDDYVYDGAIARKLGTTLTVFDEKGFTVEGSHYDADGRLDSHTKLERKGASVLKSETTATDPQQARTVTTNEDERGWLTGMEILDGTGALVERAETESRVATRMAGGNTATTTVRRTHGDGTVDVGKTVETMDAVTGISRTTNTTDGKLESDALVQRDSKGKPVAYATKSGDGSVEERKVMPDGSSVTHRYTPATQMHLYSTTDKNGHMLETTVDSPESYFRNTYAYDKAGRRTEECGWDRAGKLTQKTISRYKDDSFGNWIELKMYRWDSTMGNKPERLVSRGTRTIEYY